MIKKKYYPGIDLLKFICAILIIMIHANPLGENTLGGTIIRQIITPIAVPFFFTSSGFFLYFSSNPKNHILDVLKKYIIWSIIYFPFVIIKWFITPPKNFQKLYSVI